MENVLYPLAGGLLIGLAATLNFSFLGRITGISGILFNLFSKFKAENLWRYAFVIGLFLGGLLMKVLFPHFFDYNLEGGYLKLGIAGFLVGFGTILGGGCTSGHGVCGLPRLSVRSLWATLLFMGAGIVTVAIEGAF